MKARDIFMYNRPMGTNKSCCANCPCRYEPIVMPVREYVTDRYYWVEQPIICPINRKVINHYCPRPVYYSTYTSSEENVCEGQSGQVNTNM